MLLKKGKVDYWLVFIVAILLAIGLVMVLSSSQYAAQYSSAYDDSFYFLKRQALNAIVGIVAMLILANFHYRKLRKLDKVALIFVGILLVLVAVTELGDTGKGATQWLKLGILRFQPSELMKIALILFLARHLADNQNNLNSFSHGFVPYVLLLAGVSALVAVQDLGTGVIIACTAFILLAIGGVKPKYLLSLVVMGIGAFAVLLTLEPFRYRLQRITILADPWQDPLDTGYQTIQSLLAIGSGGFSGVGLGAGGAKWYYLPESHTDFIFSVFAEELGFIGGICLLILFAAFTWRGFNIAWRIKDTFGSLLAAGLTVAISLQAIINIGIALGVLPVTGITLPFISYGGTSLVITLASVGILLNLSRYAELDR